MTSDLSLRNKSRENRATECGRCSSEIARQHQIERQFVGPSGQAKSYACFNIHELAFVIHDGPDFVEPVVERQAMAQGPVIGILLEGRGPIVIEVISNTRCRNEFETSPRGLWLDQRVRFYLSIGHQNILNGCGKFIHVRNQLAHLP